MSFTSFCCCIPLRVGSMIIAILYTLGSFISVGLFLACLVVLFNYDGSSSFLIPSGLSSGETKAFSVAAVIAVLFFLSLFISSCRLIQGIHTSRRPLFNPFLVLACIYVFLQHLYIISCFIYPSTMVNIFSLFINNLISIYCVLCIYSYYKQLENVLPIGHL